MASKDFWEEFGYKTAKDDPCERKYGIRIATAASPAGHDGDSNGPTSTEMDIENINYNIPKEMPEEHWPDYDNFKDDLQKVIDLLQSTNAAKKAAEAKAKELQKRVDELQAEKASAEDLAAMKRDRDKYKALYEAEAEKVRSEIPSFHSIRVRKLQASVDAWTKQANENQRLLEELRKQPPKIEYIKVPGPERIIYQPDPRWTKARYEILAYRSVAWSYHPLNEQVQAALANGTYLSIGEIN
ncbi:hypothetical protein ONZ43_g4616 [Nemania bipapillata]|uniref:Uncharacterized protein n=1 Tax=Nemania bipapillata TaxID=110536 RepID=A0ACC2IKP3_9PEZI|nr:hypothetical protein ONZ43_g4616 [Nemania bipapillata]